MCQEFQWVITIGSICALVQSVIWMGLGITSALTYLCVIPVEPYKTENDFFRVTFVKLYFEGPQCIPDGSYLGKFNEEYRKILNLFTPDRVFALMIAYLILNGVYFILSYRLFLNRKNQDKRGLTLAWSGLTLVLCAIDVVLFYEIILDFFTLKNHMNSELSGPVIISSAKTTLGEVPYISLLLAVLSIRFVAFWVWNLLIGSLLFFDALCFRRIVGTSYKHESKIEEKAKAVAEEVHRPIKASSASVNLINGKYTSAFDIRTNPDYLDLKKSMEAVTRFSKAPEDETPDRENRNWSYAPGGTYWPLSKPRTSKEWDNEGFVFEEPASFEPEKQLDFDHDLKNFESGRRKTKIGNHPIGKPVSIPVPPPLPTSGSCNC